MAIMHRYQVELSPDSFRRLDAEGVPEFYAALDSAQGMEAIAPLAVAPVLRALVDAERPAVLDLMAGSDSHLGPRLQPSRLVGVGPCAAAMARNPTLSESHVLDLDADPGLPFADASFDVVLTCGALPYLARPLELFREAARVLAPGGVVLLVFDNRFDRTHAVKVWRRSTAEDRLALADYYLRCAGAFSRAQVRVSRLDDGTVDGVAAVRTVYAVFAIRADSPATATDDHGLAAPVEHRYTPEEIAARRERVGATLRCPYCDHPLSETEIPDTPFCEWDTDRLWVCFAPDCPFSRRSLGVMGRQGNLGVAYRLVYHRDRDRLYTVPDTGFADRG